MRILVVVCVLIVTLSCSCVGEPGYSVGDAALNGDSVVLDVKYGIGSQLTVGILLVDGLPTSSDIGGWHECSTEVVLSGSTYKYAGGSYPILYAESNPAWIKSPPTNNVTRSDFSSQRTNPLPRDLVARIKLGKVAAVLITDGIGASNHPKTELQYWPCVIHF